MEYSFRKPNRPVVLLFNVSPYIYNRNYTIEYQLQTTRGILICGFYCPEYLIKITLSLSR